MLTEAQCRRCIMAFLATRGDGGATEEEVHAVLTKLNDMHNDGEIVNAILGGLLLPGWDGTDLTLHKEPAR